VWQLVCPEYQSGVWMTRTVAEALLGENLEPAFYSWEHLPGLKETIDRHRAEQPDEDVQWFADQLLSIVADAQDVGEMYGLAWLRRAEGPRDSTFRGWGCLVPIQVEELADTLHGAWIDLLPASGSSVHQRLTGWIEHGRLRHRYLLRLPTSVKGTIDNDANSDGMRVGLVAQGSGNVVIHSDTSKVWITLSLPDEPLVFRLDAQPFMRKRWGRWKPYA